MSYGIERCGEDETVPKGPSGETCRRKVGHPGPHTAALPRYVGSVAWPQERAT